MTTQKRKYLTPKQKKDILSRQNNLCATCSKPLSKGDMIDDHWLALGLGGSNALDNRRFICVSCNKLKTFGSKATTAGADLHLIAKGKRLRAGPRKRKGRAIPSRPFPKKA